MAYSGKRNKKSDAAGQRMAYSGKRNKKSDAAAENSSACEFCLKTTNDPDSFGKTLCQHGITVHYFCMLFSSGLCQRGKSEKQGILGFMPEDILKERRRGCRLRCSYCKKNGATIGCVVKNCRRAFHLPCGKEYGTLHQYFDTYRSYCPEHRPKQTQSVSDRLAFHGTANTTCAICLNSVEARTSDHTLRSPCCRNSWFHRNCVQRFATSAGLYFFKCPLCNNKDSFQDEMLTCGIYIPDQDAAWETEPNAFVELLERYMHCDALLCRCIDGRDYNKDSSKWEIIVCDWCGSKGTHVHCYGLKKIGKEDVCLECKNIGDKVANQKKGSSTPKNQKFVSFQRNCEQKNKSEYPGPSGRLHKTSLPVVESAGESILHITNADTDAEIEVCAEQSQSYPLRKKIRWKHYRGSLDKLYSCKQKPKLSTGQRENNSVCEHESSKIMLSSDIIGNYQEDLTTASDQSKRRKRRRRTCKGSLDVVYSKKRRTAILLKQKKRSMFVDSKKSAPEKVKYRTVSATITSLDLDGVGDATCQSPKYCGDSLTKPFTNDSSTSPKELIYCVDNTSLSRSPILSPPISVNDTSLNKSRSKKTEYIDTQLFPEIPLGSVMSKGPKANPYAKSNRHSPRLIAQKNFESKSAIAQILSPSKHRRKRKGCKSLKYVSNRPSIMHWFHSERIVTDMLDHETVLKCSDQSDGEMECRHSEWTTSQSSLGTRNIMSKNEKKSLVIQWHEKNIGVKPTGKEMMTTSDKTSNPPKPICAVAPSPRSSSIYSPDISPIEKSFDSISSPHSAGLNRHDGAESKVGNHFAHNAKNLKITPSASVSWSKSSSSHPISDFEQMEDNAAISSRTPHSAVAKHFIAISDVIPSDSCKAKCSLDRKFTKVAGNELDRERKDSRPVGRSTCLLSGGCVVSDTFSRDSRYALCNSVASSVRNQLPLQMSEMDQEDDLEISFKSADVADTREWSAFSGLSTTDINISHSKTNDLEKLSAPKLFERDDYARRLVENEIIISSDESDVVSLADAEEILSCVAVSW